MMEGCETPQAMGARRLREAGYAADSTARKPSAYKRGGAVKGDKPEHRPDRRARGGHTKGGKIGAVNVIVGHGGEGQGGGPMMAPHPAMPPPPSPAMAPHPPMAGGAAPMAGGMPPKPPMPPGGAPAGGPVMRRGGATRARGGSCEESPMDEAEDKERARGGMIKVRGHERRRAGGAV